MTRFLLLLSCSTFVFSCTQDCPEQKVEFKNKPFSNKVLEIKLPEPSRNRSNNIVRVSVTVDNRYIVDGTSYHFDSISTLLLDKIDQDSLFTTLDIRGHKDARYEAVFKLMALADKLGLKVALAYKK